MDNEFRLAHIGLEEELDAKLHLTRGQRAEDPSKVWRERDPVRQTELIRLSKLNTSPRNWRRASEPRRTFRCSPRSTSAYPGPMTEFRGALPNVYCGCSAKQ